MTSTEAMLLGALVDAGQWTNGTAVREAARFLRIHDLLAFKILDRLVQMGLARRLRLEDSSDGWWWRPTLAGREWVAASDARRLARLDGDGAS